MRNKSERTTFRNPPLTRAQLRNLVDRAAICFLVGAVLIAVGIENRATAQLSSDFNRSVEGDGLVSEIETPQDSGSLKSILSGIFPATDLRSDPIFSDSGTGSRTFSAFGGINWLSESPTRTLFDQPEYSELSGDKFLVGIGAGKTGWATKDRARIHKTKK